MRYTNTNAEIKITAMDNDTMIPLTAKGEPWAVKIQHLGNYYMIATDIATNRGYSQHRGFLPAQSGSMAAIDYSNGLIPPPMIGDINLQGEANAIGRELWQQLDDMGAIIIRIPRLRWYLLMAPLGDCSALAGMIVSPSAGSVTACAVITWDGATRMDEPCSDWREDPVYAQLGAIATTALQHKLLVPGRRFWGEERREMGLRAALRHHGF